MFGFTRFFKKKGFDDMLKESSKSDSNTFGCLKEKTEYNTIERGNFVFKVFSLWSNLNDWINKLFGYCIEIYDRSDPSKEVVEVFLRTDLLSKKFNSIQTIDYYGTNIKFELVHNVVDGNDSIVGLSIHMDTDEDEESDTSEENIEEEES